MHRRGNDLIHSHHGATGNRVTGEYKPRRGVSMSSFILSTTTVIRDLPRLRGRSDASASGRGSFIARDNHVEPASKIRPHISICPLPACGRPLPEGEVTQARNVNRFAPGAGMICTTETLWTRRKREYDRMNKMDRIRNRHPLNYAHPVDSFARLRAAAPSEMSHP